MRSRFDNILVLCSRRCGTPFGVRRQPEGGGLRDFHSHQLNELSQRGARAG